MNESPVKPGWFTPLEKAVALTWKLGVAEALRLLEIHGDVEVEQPPFPRPARRPGDGR